MNLEDALGGWAPGGNNQPQGGPWPGQPANPTWPGQSVNPTWPGQPGGQPGGVGPWPGQPGQPSQPSWPGQPGGQPGGVGVWPGQPSQPSGPGQPSWPSPSPQPSAPGGWANPSAGPGPGPGFGPGPAAPQKNLAVPYNVSLSNGVHDKLLITIVGTVKPNANMLTVDLSASHDLAFHFNPRFNDSGRKVIVRNTRISNKWGKEERDISGNFPFIPGQRFEMKIMCTNREYKVAVNNSHLLTYQHRMSNLKSINKLSIYSDLTLSDVRMETLP